MFQVDVPGLNCAACRSSGLGGCNLRGDTSMAFSTSTCCSLNSHCNTVTRRAAAAKAISLPTPYFFCSWQNIREPSDNC